MFWKMCQCIVNVFSASIPVINTEIFGEVQIVSSCCVIVKKHPYTSLDNKVRKLATVFLQWQHWTEALVWFDDIDISAFYSCVVVDLWQSLSEWHLLLSVCVLVCRHENVRA